MLIADAWAQLGDAVAPLSNASGRPLARTVKLILDPLVLRPTMQPRFAGGVIEVEHVDALREAILEAGPALAATAAWFQLVKKARRRAGVTEGHPQDLYFQRCFELAHLHGDPRREPEAARIAAETVAEVHAERGEVTVDRLRRFVTDPARAAELTGLLHAAWEHRGQEVPPTPPGREAPTNELHGRETGARAGLAEFLERCATDPDAKLWKALVEGGVGTAEAAGLDRPGVACGYGLTDRERPAPPEIGDRASKRALPRPFDRSIMERLFAAFTAVFQRESMADIPSLVVGEIHRSAGAWQLANESGRVAMALGRDASAGLGSGPATEEGTAADLAAVASATNADATQSAAAHGVAAPIPASTDTAAPTDTEPGNGGAAGRTHLPATANAATAHSAGFEDTAVRNAELAGTDAQSAPGATSAATAAVSAAAASPATAPTAAVDATPISTIHSATSAPASANAEPGSGPATADGTSTGATEVAAGAATISATHFSASNTFAARIPAPTLTDTEPGNGGAAGRTHLPATAHAATSDANARLLRRWQRESYVHRVLRLPQADAAPPDLREDIRTVRRAYLRRLWARLHGRELRGEATEAGEVWDLLDGVLRSVVMDQRDRLKRSLERNGHRT
ncbi:hypothetical protein [Glycomyces sp. NRRL B-16210]|uniref:hypothetical protein n=1 Tax=Glycomyces sp. NRRL B-16210 TaxID=1463821 RepID=UPI0010600742|nr:hypothetical protein [Glycomyces sp. NRRL B-16210]